MQEVQLQRKPETAALLSAGASCLSLLGLRSSASAASSWRPMSSTRHGSMELSPALVLLPDGGLRLFTERLTLEQAQQQCSAECGAEGLVLSRLVLEEHGEGQGEGEGEGEEEKEYNDGMAAQESPDQRCTPGDGLMIGRQLSSLNQSSTGTSPLQGSPTQEGQKSERNTRRLPLLHGLLASHASRAHKAPLEKTLQRGGPHLPLRRATSLDPTSPIPWGPTAAATVSEPAMELSASALKAVTATGAAQGALGRKLPQKGQAVSELAREAMLSAGSTYVLSPSNTMSPGSTRSHYSGSASGHSPGSGLSPAGRRLEKSPMARAQPSPLGAQGTPLGLAPQRASPSRTALGGTHQRPCAVRNRSPLVPRNESPLSASARPASTGPRSAAMRVRHPSPLGAQQCPCGSRAQTEGTPAQQQDHTSPVPKWFGVLTLTESEPEPMPRSYTCTPPSRIAATEAAQPPCPSLLAQGPSQGPTQGPTWVPIVRCSMRMPAGVGSHVKKSEGLLRTSSLDTKHSVLPEAVKGDSSRRRMQAAKGCSSQSICREQCGPSDSRGSSPALEPLWSQPNTPDWLTGRQLSVGRQLSSVRERARSSSRGKRRAAQVSPQLTRATLVPGNRERGNSPGPRVGEAHTARVFKPSPSPQRCGYSTGRSPEPYAHKAMPSPQPQNKMPSPYQQTHGQLPLGPKPALPHADSSPLPTLVIRLGKDGQRSVAWGQRALPLPAAEGALPFPRKAGWRRSISQEDVRLEANFGAGRGTPEHMSTTGTSLCGAHLAGAVSLGCSCSPGAALLMGSEHRKGRGKDQLLPAAPAPAPAHPLAPAPALDPAPPPTPALVHAHSLKGIFGKLQAASTALVQWPSKSKASGPASALAVNGKDGKDAPSVCTQEEKGPKKYSRKRGSAQQPSSPSLGRPRGNLAHAGIPTVQTLMGPSQLRPVGGQEGVTCDDISTPKTRGVPGPAQGKVQACTSREEVTWKAEGVSKAAPGQATRPVRDRGGVGFSHLLRTRSLLGPQSMASLLPGETRKEKMGGAHKVAQESNVRAPKVPSSCTESKLEREMSGFRFEDVVCGAMCASNAPKQSGGTSKALPVRNQDVGIHRKRSNRRQSFDVKNNCKYPS